MNNNIVEIAMTIFPELGNPNYVPRVMGIFPYLSDTQVKTKVVEFVYDRLVEEMGNNFHENRLRRFLNENRDDIFDMVEELMTEYPDIYQPEENIGNEIVERLLSNYIVECFSHFIDMDGWIQAQPQP